MKKVSFFLTIPLIALIFASCGENIHSQNGGKSAKVNAKDRELLNDINDKKNPSALETSAEPKALRIYIDHSGSMRGYTEFDYAKFVSAISDLQSIMRNDTYFWGDKNAVDNTKVLGQVLAQHNFNGADTPFPKIFEAMVAHADTTRQINFIITDGIISLKANEMNYLESSLGQIKNQIRDAIKSRPGMAVCVYRLVSGYSNNKGGKDFYYTFQPGKSVKLKDVQRPFFVIAIGHRDNVQWLVNHINANKATTLTAYNNADCIAFGLHRHDVKLNFGKNERYFTKTKTGLKLKASSGSFTIKPKLPPCLLTSMTVDEIQQNIEMLVNGQKEKDPIFSLSVVGTNLMLKCKNISRIKKMHNVVTIKLPNIIPAKWKEYSSDDDSNIANDADQQNRTYALYTLLQGLYEATDAGTMLIDAEFTFDKK